jgi:hypothetical protein
MRESFNNKPHFQVYYKENGRGHRQELAIQIFAFE